MTGTSFTIVNLQICLIGELTGGNALKVMMYRLLCLSWFPPAVVIINWDLISAALERPQRALIRLIIPHELKTKNLKFISV